MGGPKKTRIKVSGGHILLSECEFKLVRKGKGTLSGQIIGWSERGLECLASKPRKVRVFASIPKDEWDKHQAGE